jgi:hypothetical protein
MPYAGARPMERQRGYQRDAPWESWLWPLSPQPRRWRKPIPGFSAVELRTQPSSRSWDRPLSPQQQTAAAEELREWRLSRTTGAAIEIVKVRPGENHGDNAISCEIPLSNLSVPLVLEYEQTLKRVCTGGDLSSSDVDSVVHFLCANASLRPSSFFSGHSFPIPRMILFWNWPSKAGPISY